MRVLILTGLLSAILAGCGFRLVGSRSLPAALQRTCIIDASNSPSLDTTLNDALRLRLNRRGAKVGCAQASGYIELLESQEQRQTLSVGSDGKAIEFQITNSISFRLLDADKQPRTPAQTIRQSRDYSFNASQVLAKEAEERRLREYLQNELAELMLIRLDAQLAATVSSPATVAVPTTATGG